jgi:DNA mismatch repair protein MutS
MAETTALMRQYLDVKARYPDAIVFFRLGDFYEMFLEDAVYAARVLDLTLTTRDKGKEDPVPMCGIPHHAVRPYLVKLTELGHRVALCEQLEDPRAVRGIVKRDVVRVVTPGVVLDEESLDPRSPSYVAAALGDGRGGYGLAILDVTTGDFRATEAATVEALVEEIGRVSPRELVFGRGDDDRRLADLVRAAHASIPRTTVVDGTGRPSWRARSAPGAWTPPPPSGRRAPWPAAGAVLRYVAATQPGVALPVARLEIYRRDDTLVIDEQARRHLELTESLLDRRRSGSLIEVLDESRTAMGGQAAAALAAVPVGGHGRHPPPPRRGRAPGRRARGARCGAPGARRRRRRGAPGGTRAPGRGDAARSGRAGALADAAAAAGGGAGRGATGGARRLARRRGEPAGHRPGATSWAPTSRPS